ncbi:MAG: hypothetical protein ABJA02_14095 [Acidobacteriota bacterium]
MKNYSSTIFCRLVLTSLLIVLGAASGVVGQSPTPAPAGGQTWQFAASGDSRNCGDIVMPTIAGDLSRSDAKFYWHLGDLRWISDFDEDIRRRPGLPPMSIATYENTAWQDMIENQINKFNIPFYLGIGNHETAYPKTRIDFLFQFADWLNAPMLQAQRLKDDPNDHKLRAYFHWQQGGVDFIYMDNATPDQFDRAQLNWFNKVVAADEADAGITSIVVGMHEALPDSLSQGHSMSDYPVGTESGRKVYKRLIEARDRGHKMVYVLASHSHFLMEGIFDSDYWRANGGVLPGWIVGTAGAHRYKLPAEAARAKTARTNVYGYLMGTVNPPGEPLGTIRFDFKELKESDVPAATKTMFGDELTHWCFEQNTDAN